MYELDTTNLMYAPFYADIAILVLILSYLKLPDDQTTITSHRKNIKPINDPNFSLW